MSTSFEPAASELRAPLSRAASHYRDSAELCAAILAAANLAPEFPPEPVKLIFPAGAYEPGRETRIESADGSIDWAEWQGPLIPRPAPRQDARTVFAYRMADGTRGQVSSANDRPALLALAERLGTPAAARAWSGKVRSGPVKRSAPAGSAAHVAARGMLQAGEYPEALALAEAGGAVFFGAGSALNLYMGTEPAQAGGFEFVIGRMVRTGRFRVLHTGSGRSVDSLRLILADGDRINDSGFSSGAAARDWLESASACDAWRARLAAAVPKAESLCQVKARAAFLAGDEPAAAGPETGRRAHEAAPVATGAHCTDGAPESAPIEPAARYQFGAHLIGTDSQRIESVTYTCTGPGLTSADVDGAHAELRRLATAHGLRVLSVNFSEYEARAWCEPDPAAAPREVDPAGPTDAQLIGAARLTVYQYLPTWAKCAIERADSDSGLRHGAAVRELCHAYARTYGTVPGADELGSVLHICARRFHDYRPILAQAAPDSFAAGFAYGRTNGARELTAREIAAQFPAADCELFACGMLDGLNGDAWRAELRAAPGPVATHSAPPPVPTHSEPAPRAPRDGDRFRIHERTRTGEIWTGSETSTARRAADVLQCVIGGFANSARWATCAETGALLYGVDARGVATHRAGFFPFVAPEPSPVPVNTGAPEKPAAPDWFAEILAKADARKFRARVLADGAEFKEFGGGSVRMVHANDATRYGLAGPCMSTPGRFRFTHFDAHGPVGDLGFTCLADAIDEAMQMGYEPVPAGAPDPAGLHPLPGKSEPARPKTPREMSLAYWESQAAEGRSGAARICQALRTRADPLPVATHSQDSSEPAPLEFVSRYTGPKCAGMSEVSAKIERARREKAEPGFVFKVAPCKGEGLAPWQVAAMRGRFEVQRFRVAPVASEPEPAKVSEIVSRVLEMLAMVAPGGLIPARMLGSEAARIDASADQMASSMPRVAAQYRTAAADLRELAATAREREAAARPVHSLARLRKIHDRINATRATTSTAHGRRWVRIMNRLRTLMHSHPDYAAAHRAATVIRAAQARPAAPLLRIPEFDARLRVPPTFKPGYLLRAGA